MRLAGLALCGLALVAGAAEPAGGRNGVRSAASTRFYMHNVVMFPFPDAPSTVVRLNGVAVPARPGWIIDMDDVASYAVRVRSAEMIMPAQTMAVLMNRYILPGADTAIKRVDVAFGSGSIGMRGVMRKPACRWASPPPPSPPSRLAAKC